MVLRNPSDSALEMNIALAEEELDMVLFQQGSIRGPC